MSKKIEKSLDIDLSVIYDYYPGYPAPFARNHDDPRFSDPGEPDYVDNIRIIFNNEIDITELIEEFAPEIYAQIECMVENDF